MHLKIEYKNNSQFDSKERAFEKAERLIGFATRYGGKAMRMLMAELRHSGTTMVTLQTRAEFGYLQKRLPEFDFLVSDASLPVETPKVSAALTYNQHTSGSDKIQAIRVLMAWADMSLKEAKTLLDDLQAWPGNTITIEVADYQFFRYAAQFMNAWEAREVDPTLQENEMEDECNCDRLANVSQRLRDLAARFVQDGHYDEASLLICILLDIED